MSKPKNMTPEQEAAWREKNRQRMTTPEYREKSRARHAAKVANGYKNKRNHYERNKLAKNQDASNNYKRRLSIYRTSEKGKAKRSEYQKMYNEIRRTNRQFEQFMRRLLSGEDVYGIITE